MLAFGCEMETIYTDAYEAKLKAAGATDSSIHGGRVELLPRRMCLELEQERDDVWWARQFSNPWNTLAHRD